MAVTINGTTGVAVPLGSASAPGVVNTTSATTGIYNPTSTTLGLSTNGTNAVYINASQNVGVGTTPNAWSTVTALQMAGPSLWGSSSVGHLSVNTYFDGTDYKYISTAAATDYYQLSGTHVWRYAASGTAGATVTFSEAMRTDSSGNVSIGTTAFFARLAAVSSGGTTLALKNAASGGYARESYVSSNAGTYYFDFYGKYADNANLGSIASNGTTMTYATSSDVRLKENIVDAPSALPTLAALQVRSFDWKTGPHHKFGFIAQEVVEIDPNAVAKGPTEDDMWGVDTSVLVPMLIKAVQELSAEVEALKAKVGA